MAHYPADSVLPRTDQRRVAGALERVDIVCNGDGTDKIRRSALNTLSRIAGDSPGGVYVSEFSNSTMVEVLDDLAGSYPDCGLSKDLGDVASELRAPGP